MECLAVSKLPDGPNWLWEIKLDGYRAIAVKNGGMVSLWSRNRKSLNRQFPQIAEALKQLPDGTVVDGELVAIDDSARPNFNLLQNFRSAANRIRFYIFDLLLFEGRDLTQLDLVQRRDLAKSLPVQAAAPLRDNRLGVLVTWNPPHTRCCPQFARKDWKELSVNGRTACTNRASVPARG
jgi:ATP-dependent DNA ligase